MKFDLSVILKLIDKASGPLKKFGNQAKQVGKTISMRVSAPLAALGALSLNSAITMESAFAGVTKTVNGTAEQLQGIQKGLVKMSGTVPILTKDLFGMAESAGQLGIKTENVLGFTKVMADLQATTNLQDAATSMARFANITGMSQKNFDRLGSVVVQLGNNLATTEEEIMSMGLRLAGAGRAVGMTEAQVLGLAGALSSVGLRAELGGTSFSMVMKTIAKQVGTGSKSMDKFAAVAGKSTAEFEKSFKDNAGAAMIEFIDGLDKLSKTENIVTLLDNLGFKGMGVSDSLLRAAGASKKFADAQRMGTKAWKENTALAKEAEIRYKTTAAELVMLRNKASNVASEFGKIMLPMFKDLIVFLGKVTDGIRGLSPFTKKLLVVCVGLGAIIGPLVIGLGTIAALMPVIAAGFAIIWGPIGLVTAAIVAITAAFIYLFTQWDKFKAAFGGSGSKFISTVMAGSMGMSPNIPNQKSQNEIKVVVAAEPGTKAGVASSKGDGNVTAEAYTGPTFNFGM